MQACAAEGAATPVRDNEVDEGLLACKLGLAEIAERVRVMKCQEESNYRSLDYLGENGGSSPWSSRIRGAVTSECRSRLAGWCFQVADICQYSRETVDVAMSMLDRFCSTNSVAALKALRDKAQYQLAAMTCLYIAVKLYEPVSMETRLLSNLSRGEYSASELGRMESCILTALKWRVQGPTRLAFCEHFLGLFLPCATTTPNPFRRINDDVAQAIVQLSQFQTEVATGDYFFTAQRHSTTAIACVLNAIDAIREASDITMALRMDRLEQQFRQSLLVNAGMNSVDPQVVSAKSRLLENLGSADLLDFLSDELKMKFTVEEDDDDNSEDEENEEEEDTVMSYETKLSMKVYVSRDEGAIATSSSSPVSITQTTITATTTSTSAARVAVPMQQ